MMDGAEVAVGSERARRAKPEDAQRRERREVGVKERR